MNRNSRNIVIIVCFVMLLIGVFLLSFNYLLDKRDYAFETINLRIDNNKEPEEVKSSDEKKEEEFQKKEEEFQNDSLSSLKKRYRGKNSYIGILEIPKIGLTKGFLSINSKRNNVNYNLQVIKPSDYPDVDKGMFIVAAHSGSAAVSYFKNLYKVNKEDVVYVYYKNKKYIYKIVNIYTQPKNGQINVYRNFNVSNIVLVTCTKNDEKTQTVYIGELINKEDYNA